VRRNLGQRTFALPSHSVTSQEAAEMRLADLDGDGERSTSQC